MLPEKTVEAHRKTLSRTSCTFSFPCIRIAAIAGKYCHCPVEYTHGSFWFPWVLHPPWHPAFLVVTEICKSKLGICKAFETNSFLVVVLQNPWLEELSETTPLCMSQHSHWIKYTFHCGNSQAALLIQQYRRNNRCTKNHKHPSGSMLIEYWA